MSKQDKLFIPFLGKSLNHKEVSLLKDELEVLIRKNYNNLKNKPYFKIKKKFEFNILYDPKYIDLWSKYYLNIWERNLFSILDKKLKFDQVFIDIGAWIGPVTLYASKISKKVISVEPDIKAFKILKEHISINNIENVELVDKAISSNNGVSINLGSPELGNSGTSIFYNSNDSIISVNAINFEKFINKYNLNDANIFFKIDIEGAEFEIIKNSKHFFKKLNNEIHITFHPLIYFKNYKFKNYFFNSKLLFISFLYFFYFKSLPYKYIYFNNLKKINYFKILIKTFLYGLPEEIHIFATNVK